MIENGFYKIKQEYIDLVHSIGGKYNDSKQRPVYCCVEDKYISDLYWAIPTSDLSHRTPEQLAKISHYCQLDNRDPRWAYYYIGHTNRPALYRISNCLPITNKYIDAPYTSQGSILILQKKSDIAIIRKKLSRILLVEKQHPNHFEQHITDIKEIIIEELK